MRRTGCAGGIEMNQAFTEKYRAVVPQLFRPVFVRNKKNRLPAALFKNTSRGKCEQRSADAGDSYRLRCRYTAQCTEQRLERFAFG
jgi:NAD-dependent DNA ligase